MWDKLFCRIVFEEVDGFADRGHELGGEDDG